MKKEIGVYMIVINGVFVNRTERATAVPGMIFEQMAWLNFASFETLLDWVDGVEELCREGIDESCAINRICKQLDFLRSIKTREELVERIYDTILASAGLGRLNGFGIAKCETNEGRRKVKQRYFENPEITSIRNTGY